jgi:hypothetical protein
MSFLQTIPESVQLFILGFGFFSIGILLRKVRRVNLGFRPPLPAERQPEPRQS